MVSHSVFIEGLVINAHMPSAVFFGDEQNWRAGGTRTGPNETLSQEVLHLLLHFILLSWTKSVRRPTRWFRVAGVPTGRSLIRCPPAATGMAACLSDNLYSLAPALHFHLQASSKRTYAHTTRSHRTPPIGVQSQGTHVHCSHAQTRHNAGKRILA